MQPRYEFVTEDFDDPRIEEVRERVRLMNETQKEKEKNFPMSYYSRHAGYTSNGEYVYGKGAIAHHRYYVWLRGRGNRTSPEKIKAFEHAWKQRYGKECPYTTLGIKYRLAQDLPVWMAERVAVYIMEKITYHKPEWHK